MSEGTNIMPRGDDHRTIGQHVIRRITGLLAPDPRDATPELNLRDNLGYNSLALVELSFALEDAFGLDQISRRDGRKIRTVADIETYIFGKTDERGYVFVDDDPDVALAVVADVESWGALDEPTSGDVS